MRRFTVFGAGKSRGNPGGLEFASRPPQGKFEINPVCATFRGLADQNEFLEIADYICIKKKMGHFLLPETSLAVKSRKRSAKGDDGIGVKRSKAAVGFWWSETTKADRI